MQADTAGKFGGIGIHIGIRDGILTVISPIEDTPAFRAGLLAGDRILKIEGERTRGMSLREAVEKLRGEQGTEVTITVHGAATGEERDVTMVRDEIEVPSVKGTRVIRDGVGYVRITQFTRPTAASLQEALEELAAQDVKGLVLDLRNNPGGLLTSAVEVAQKFLKKRTPIVSTRGRPGVHKGVEVKARGKDPFTDFPMAVLVNGGSASASEIVAGALQDNKRAVLVGGQTFGKGSVQSVIRLKPDGKSAIRLTTAHYYTPSGRLIHDVGIKPDITVEVTPGEWRKVQLKRAREENPEFFMSEEDAAENLEGVVDEPLERAIDILVAMRILTP
jgi:carboxyl-terminal processing protease